MSDPEAIADGFQIEELRGKFTDASMTRDRDRFALWSRAHCGALTQICVYVSSGSQPRRGR